MSPLYIHLGDDQQLALSRKPKKRPVSSFEEWVQGFTVYANTLCAHNPSRSPDMLGYLFVTASSLQEFSLPAVLAYDVHCLPLEGCAANKKLGQLPPALSALAGHSPADGSFLSSDQPRQPGAPQLVHVIQPPFLDKSAIGGGATTSIPADTKEHTHTHILMVRPTQLVVYTNLGAHGTSSAQSGGMEGRMPHSTARASTPPPSKQ